MDCSSFHCSFFMSNKSGSVGLQSKSRCSGIKSHNFTSSFAAKDKTTSIKYKIVNELSFLNYIFFFLTKCMFSTDISVNLEFQQLKQKIRF